MGKPEQSLVGGNWVNSVPTNGDIFVSADAPPAAISATTAITAQRYPHTVNVRLKKCGAKQRQMERCETKSRERERCLIPIF